METGQPGASAGDAPTPNAEAIAWYVEEARRLLEDQQRRAESLRTRGGQIAGFGAAVLALIVGSMFGLLGDLGEGMRVIVGVELGMAGLLLAVAVATAIWGALRPRGFAEISAEEIFRFTAEPFLFEPDLWRVHVRHLRSLGLMALGVQDAAEAAANAIARALLAFLGGLAFSFLAIATLLVELV